MFKNRKAWLAVVALILAVAVVGFSGLLSGEDPKNQRMPAFAVQKGPLTISVTESGTIKARDQLVIKSQVEGKTTILWLVPEATRVAKGDLLVEVDCERLRAEKRSARAEYSIHLTTYQNNKTLLRRKAIGNLVDWARLGRPTYVVLEGRG